MGFVLSKKVKTNLLPTLGLWKVVQQWSKNGFGWGLKNQEKNVQMRVLTDHWNGGGGGGGVGRIGLVLSFITGGVVHVIHCIRASCWKKRRRDREGGGKGEFYTS